MNVTRARVREEYRWIHDRAPRVVEVINDTRAYLSDVFGVEVEPVTESAFREEVDVVFADGPRAVNVAAYVGLLRDLDVEDDYPGFVVDEVLGRELAATIAGGDPLGLLAQATFHVADVRTTSAVAGVDDLEAALAAGFQTRLPGWAWRVGESPFAIPLDEGDDGGSEQTGNDDTGPPEP